jgi:alpha/beta superfamily hydrolase
VSQWDEYGTWVGEDLRREVFFFRSGDTELYGSLYAAAELSSPVGVVACGSWGTEADRTDALLRKVVVEAARLGGAGLVFHYPGYGDSYGDLADVEMADLSRAASRAVEEATSRCRDLTWLLAGFMFGASVASLAHRSAGVEQLLLVQPDLRPGRYFERLAKTRRPLAPGPSPRQMMEVGTASGMAYGYPVPARILESGRAVDATVSDALEDFHGHGAVVRHPGDEPDHAPPRFERVEVPGAWRFGSQNNPRLAQAAVAWLEQCAVGAVR